MGVSIILIAYYADAWLPACVESLKEASKGRLHLVLGDNAGNTVVDRLDYSAFEYEIIDFPHPMGFADANNHALAHAARLEDYVLFLNQDTVGRPGWIDRCVDCFERSAELGAVSPMIWTYDWEGWDGDFLSFVSASHQNAELDTTDPAAGDWFEVKDAPAPALLVRTDILHRIGPFDPIFGSYYEDVDLCFRVRKQGYKIGFCKAGAIGHYNGSTTTDRARELKRTRQIIRNQTICKLRETEGSRAMRLARMGVSDFPKRLLRGLLGRSAQAPSAIVKAYWDIFKLSGRLASRTRDEAVWHAYLRELGWPDRIPGLTGAPFVREPHANVRP